MLQVHYLNCNDFRRGCIPCAPTGWLEPVRGIISLLSPFHCPGRLDSEHITPLPTFPESLTLHEAPRGSKPEEQETDQATDGARDQLQNPFIVHPSTNNTRSFKATTLYQLQYTRPTAPSAARRVQYCIPSRQSDGNISNFCRHLPFCTWHHHRACIYGAIVMHGRKMRYVLLLFTVSEAAHQKWRMSMSWTVICRYDITDPLQALQFVSVLLARHGKKLHDLFQYKVSN